MSRYCSPYLKGNMSTSSPGHNSLTAILSDTMNITNSSQSASWSHSTVSGVSNPNDTGLGNHQHGSPGAPSVVDHDTKVTAPPSPHGSSQSGTTLKEHDLLGLSEVSSSSTRLDSSSQNSFRDEGHQSDDLNLNLNLGTTELRLGPQDAKKKIEPGYHQRSAVVEQGSVSISENGKFLGGLDGINTRTDQGTFPSDKRSSNSDQMIADSEQPHDRAFTYSGLASDRGLSNSKGGRSDTVESTSCRPLIEIESSPKWQQLSHPPQQEESSRIGYNGPLGGFSGGRVAFANGKPGVTGAKRPFDRIGVVSDARNFNDSKVGLPSPANGLSSVITGNPSEVDATSKVQPALYPPWGSNPPPTWQMLQHSGGSFGPFPSQAPARNPAIPTVNKSTGEVASGGEPAQKGWEGHLKSQEPASNLSQMISSPSEMKQVPAQPSSSSPDAASAPRAPAPAVGWPPLRSFRKSTLAAQSRPSPVETPQSRAPVPPPQAASPAPVATQSNFCFVKVYMDGVPIGRKVDLKTNSSYDKLSLVLEDMFRGFVSGQQGCQGARDISLPSDKRHFLRGSDYVLTYEDKDGDLMLVGDVPWTMFLATVNRLRIMKGSEAIGLGSRSAEKVKQNTN